MAVGGEGEGRLKDLLHALLEAELNIHSVYPFLPRPGGESGLVIHIEDQEIAEQSLRQHQFRVLYQPDLAC